jgi:hypothetical protein
MRYSLLHETPLHDRMIERAASKVAGLAAIAANFPSRAVST